MMKGWEEGGGGKQESRCGKKKMRGTFLDQKKKGGGKEDKLRVVGTKGGQVERVAANCSKKLTAQRSRMVRKEW